MSDARLISRISRFFEVEALDDIGEAFDRDAYADRKRLARQVIAIVRKADKRRNKRARSRPRK